MESDEQNIGDIDFALRLSAAVLHTVMPFCCFHASQRGILPHLLPSLSLMDRHHGLMAHSDFYLFQSGTLVGNAMEHMLFIIVIIIRGSPVEKRGHALQQWHGGRGRT